MQIKDLRPKRALCTALLVLLLNSVGMTKGYADTFTIGNLNYSVNSDSTSVTLTGHVDGTAATGELIIPESIEFEGETYSVTKIGAHAFQNCVGLTGSLQIPNTITQVAGYAFDGCTGFNGSLTIGNSVTGIYSGAFRNCYGFSGSLTLGSSVEQIFSDAFRNCYGFTSINFLAQIPPYIWAFGIFGMNNSIPAVCPCGTIEAYQASNIGFTFHEDGTCPISFADTNVKAICVANWDTDEDGELSYNEATAVTNLGMVFQGNQIITSFDELQYFTGLTTIAFGSFTGCSGLTSVVIPTTIISIEGNPFISCDNLAEIVVKEGNAYYDSRNGCNAIIETATNKLVSGCQNTVVPDGVTTIGEKSFFGGSNLTTITIPNSVTKIEDAAFHSCGLVSVSLSENLTEIGQWAFHSCNNLTSISIPNGVTSLGAQAFINCYSLLSVSLPSGITTIPHGLFQSCGNLASITIPSGITFISSCAFLGCYNLASITILAETPPVLDNESLGDIFVDVSKSIPVYVPCGTIEAYQNAEGWNEFTNLQENIPEIEVVSSDESLGTVAILQEPDCENEAIVQATPIGDYTFFNWTENGEIVSTEAIYTFTPTEDRTLVANFGEITNHWTPNANAYEENMTFTCVLQLDGVEQRTTTLEIGAFCGEECRGTQLATYFPPTDRYIIQLLVFGETNDVISFRLYDHQLQQELLLTPPESVAFNSNGYGSLLNPYVLNFTSNVLISAETNPADAGTITGTGDYTIGSEVTLTAEANSGYQFFNWTLNGEVVSTNASYQFTVTEAATYVANFKYVHTQALNNGWSWWSSYIELSNNDGLGQLENSIGSAGILIKSRNSGYVEAYQYNDTTNWFGTLSSVNNDQMYKIHTNAACDAIIVGDVALPSDHPIEINNGWNWVGFPCSQSVSVDVAMSGFSPENNDIIKGRNGFTTYYSDGNYTMWFGTLNIFEPGQGYMYRSNSITQKSLVFETSRGEGYNDNITPENNVFRPADGSFADNMTFTAVVELDGIELRSEDYELAAFVGDECRGSVKLMYVEPFNRYIAFLTIFGEQEEDLHFQLTDGVAMSFSTDQLSYVVDGIMGTLDNPIVLHFGTMDVDENALVNVRVYPNPSEGIFNIEGKNIRKVEVFNMFGQPIYSEGTGNGFLKLDLTSRAAGIYLIRIVTDNGIWNNQIIKR